MRCFFKIFPNMYQNLTFYFVLFQSPRLFFSLSIFFLSSFPCAIVLPLFRFISPFSSYVVDFLRSFRIIKATWCDRHYFCCGFSCGYFFNFTLWSSKEVAYVIVRNPNSKRLLSFSSHIYWSYRRGSSVSSSFSYHFLSNDAHSSF